MVIFIFHKIYVMQVTISIEVVIVVVVVEVMKMFYPYWLTTTQHTPSQPAEEQSTVEKMYKNSSSSPLVCRPCSFLPSQTSPSYLYFTKYNKNIRELKNIFLVNKWFVCVCASVFFLFWVSYLQLKTLINYIFNKTYQSFGP